MSSYMFSNIRKSIFSKKFPNFRQMDAMDCGPTCLKIISSFYGKLISKEAISDSSDFGLDGVSIRGLLNGAEKINFRALPISTSFSTLRDEVPLPCIAYWKQSHFLVVYDINDRHIFISDPAVGLIKYDIDFFISNWTSKTNNEGEKEGILILLEPSNEFFNDKKDLNDTYEQNASGQSKVTNKSGLAFLIPYLRPFRKSWIQLFLGLLAVIIIQLIIPFITQSVVDYGIAYQDMKFIYLLLLAQIVLFISKTSVEIIRDWLLLHVGSRISVTILTDFLIKLLKLPISFFESRSTGDILQRVQDHRVIQQFLSDQSLLLMFSVLNLIVFGVVLAFFNSFIFLVYLIGTILYVLWILAFMKKRKIINYMRFDQMSASQSSSMQIIQGMTEVKLNNSERRRRWEWEEIQVKYHKVEMKNLSLFHLQRTGGNFVSEIKNILITFLAAKAVIDGEITLGTMLSIQYIIGQLNGPVTSLIDFIMGFQNAKISLDRISEIHDRQDEDTRDHINHNLLNADKSIEVRNLSFKYRNDAATNVLTDLNMDIPAGKVTAIVGTSGSGKTTLIKLLLKLYNPYEGTIKIGGIKIKDLNTSFLRDQCGVVMQDGFIFSDTILRNITESQSEMAVNRERLLNAVRLANLETFIDSLPSGYNTRIANYGNNLSGGQKQRLLIARAIYKNPEFLFLDEATSSLDANNEKTIMENLQQFYINKTVVVVAHRLSTVKNADQIIVLNNGRIVEQGNHLELVNLQGSYYNLVKNQLELGK